MIFSLVEEVPFAAIVDKRYGIDRAESLFERRTAARFEMKSGNSSRAGSAPDKRVGIELELKVVSRLGLLESPFCEPIQVRRSSSSELEISTYKTDLCLDVIILPLVASVRNYSSQ